MPFGGKYSCAPVPAANCLVWLVENGYPELAPAADNEKPYLHNPPKDSRTVVFSIMGMAHKLRGGLGAAAEAFSDATALGQEHQDVHLVVVAFGHPASAFDMLASL